jgi:SpoVK/Ycf46/Vps4 family AAA+-type ATPase
MTVRKKKENEKELPSFYPDSFSHLKDELRKLDLLIRRRITQYRLQSQTMQKTLPVQRMYIGNEEVDWLLEEHDISININEELNDIERRLKFLQDSIIAKVHGSINQGVFLSLPQLARLFGLSDFELQAVVICMAPELDRKYDRLYAYLQDDITRKKPSIDLVLDILCHDEINKWSMRSYFSDASPLVHAGILHKRDDPQSPSGSSGLAQFLQLDPRILNHLLGDTSIDGRLMNIINVLKPLSSMETVLIDSAIKTKLLHFTKQYFSINNSHGKRAILHIHGPYGAGKKEVAQALCGQLNCHLIYLDMDLLRIEDSNREEILRLVFREGLLLQGALYLDNVDELLNEENDAKAFTKKLAQVCREYGWLTFLAGEKPWTRKGIFDSSDFLSIELSTPDVPIRQAVWERSLCTNSTRGDATWACQLANQFRLTPGQIQDAIKSTYMQSTMNSDESKITLIDFFKACRSQSNQKLGELAIKIEPRYHWEDIVLPEDKLAQLKEICSQVNHRHRVLGEWGFGQKISRGKGLSTLFSGPSGTGKTMAAEVIAHELCLDLYKVDLSGVVSKYIGETEKNLAKVFQEAETSNAILFFDEADALFGKRTEVSDAHDRYANIETSYLLQKMEEYEGVVILATNLRENMDEAFTRRIRFIVEFPFPDEISRLKIWRTHFPNEAPLSEEIDYVYLSKQFQIAGGNIKNIVLNAAYLAAGNGGVIGMNQILYGAKREFEKIGKLWDEKIFSKSQGSKKVR